MSTDDPRRLLRDLEQRARRRFGQHFLTRLDIVEAIVRSADVAHGDRVVEIGPGLGILTGGLLAAGAELTAIELDRDLVGWLREQFPDMRLIEGDAARQDWPTVCPGSGWKVVANLPYNVSTRVVMGLLDHPDTFASITVMVQREVADRLVAVPRTKAYGGLSVRARVRAKIRPVLQVPPSAFHPPPKVRSSVIRLDLLPTPDVGPIAAAAFDHVVRAAFSQRRKTLLNALAPLYGRDAVREALVGVGVDPGQRAEELDLAAFRAVAAALPAGRDDTMDPPEPG